MKKKVLFILLAFIIMMPFTVKATDCSVCSRMTDKNARAYCTSKCTTTTTTTNQSRNTTTSTTISSSHSTNSSTATISPSHSINVKTEKQEASTSSSTNNSSISTSHASEQTTNNTQTTNKAVSYKKAYCGVCSRVQVSDQQRCLEECIDDKQTITKSKTTTTTPATSSNSFSNDETVSACGVNLPKNLPNFTSKLYDLVKICVPIVIIVLGMFDFFKAMTSSSEDKARKSKDVFIRRLVAGVIIFFLMVLVELVFNHVDISEKNGMISCMKCILSNNSCGEASSNKTEEELCSNYSKDDCPEFIVKGNGIMCTSHNGKCVFDCSRLSLSQCSKHSNICKQYNGGCTFKD